MRCPLCNATFQAPAMPGGQATAAPARLEEPAVIEPVVVSEPPPPPPRDAYTPEPPRPAPPLEEVYATEPATARAPSREYIRCCSVSFSLPIVTWIAPGALLLVFIFSFLPWYGFFLAPTEATSVSRHAWAIGFGTGGQGLIAIFDIFMILALLAAIPSALIAINVIPFPPAMKFWRPVVLAALVGLTFVFLFIQYIDWTFRAAPLTIWPKLVWRLMFIATITSVMEIWLEMRRSKNLPPPKVEFYR